MTATLVRPAVALCLFIFAYSGRNFINLGLLERPLVLGLFWALFFGEPVPALPLALFFELFWLDRFHIGSYLPPFPAFPFMLLMAVAGGFSWYSPQALFFPLVFSLPLAYVVPHLENYARNTQSASYDLLIASVTHSGFTQTLSRILRHAVCYQLLACIGIFSAVGTIWYVFLSLIGDVLLPYVTTWAGIISVGCLGAVLALRISPAYKTLGIVIVICAAVKSV